LRSRLGFFSWEALKEYVIASSLNSSAIQRFQAYTSRAEAAASSKK
jgi:hypothetical protein